MEVIPLFFRFFFPVFVQYMLACRPEAFWFTPDACFLALVVHGLGGGVTFIFSVVTKEYECNEFCHFKGNER